MSRSKDHETVYINEAEPFGLHSEDVLEALREHPDWVVVNAPRPIPGNMMWQTGPCRHGIFYAAGPKAIWENASMGWEALDAWFVEIVDNDFVAAKVREYARENDLSLPQLLSDHGRDSLDGGWCRTANILGLPWDTSKEAPGICGYGDGSCHDLQRRGGRACLDHPLPVEDLEV